MRKLSVVSTTAHFNQTIGPATWHHSKTPHQNVTIILWLPCCDQLQPEVSRGNARVAVHGCHTWIVPVPYVFSTPINYIVSKATCRASQILRCFHSKDRGILCNAFVV